MVPCLNVVFEILVIASVKRYTRITSDYLLDKVIEAAWQLDEILSEIIHVMLW